MTARPASARRRRALAWSLVLAACGGTSPPSPPSRPASMPPAATDPATGAPPDGRAPATARVANADPGSVGREPDYDAMARDLAAAMAPQVAGAQDPAAECRALFDAAAQRYESIDGPKAARRRVVAQLRATRAADERACRAALSPKAARCAAILVSQARSELDHAVDRCTRAFSAGR